MFKVQLQQFEGPMDLLLFFIRRDELDVHDIPIAEITEEYLAYVRVLKEVDLDGVGDFLYMAAVLINIKARLLLPQPDHEDGEEPLDPRKELVERLLEYVRFKEATDTLEMKREARLDHFLRGIAAVEHLPRNETTVVLDDSGSVFDLIRALQRLLREVQPEPVYDVEHESYSIEEQVGYVLEQLRTQERCSFRGLIEGTSKPFIIATFLATLEMARQGRIFLLVPGDHTDFFVERGARFADALAEGVPSDDGMVSPSNGAVSNS